MTPVEASDGRSAFCARLKHERERRGTSLADIAASTKIKASLLEALERGDLSRWPKGLYQRAFFREYVAAIGLAPDDVTPEFAELFADGETSGTTAATSASPKGALRNAAESTPKSTPKNTETFRLLLGPGVPAPPSGGRVNDAATRLAFAVAAVSVVLFFALIVSAISRLTMVQAALVFGVAAYLVSAAIGESPLLWLVTRAGRTRQAASAQSIPSTFTPGALPFHVDGSSSPVLTFTDRFAEAVASGRALLQDRIERLSVSELTASSQRRRELASLRRQRAETANRATADELVL